jgi:WD40-like Beta Propeller Repeat
VSLLGGNHAVRWALAVLIGIVVVVGAVLAIDNTLGGGKKAATAGSRRDRGHPLGYCLSPKRVTLSQAGITPRIPARANPRASFKTHLAAAESVVSSHRSLGLTVAPSGKRFLFVEPNGRWVLGRVGGRRKLFRIAAVDMTFSGNGRRIIFERPALASHRCASLVLLSMGLNGRHRRLLLASGAFRLANSAKVGEKDAVLNEDVLPSGWIILAHGEKLYAFEPGRHTIRPVETRKVTPLDRFASTQSTTVIHFKFSDGGQFVAAKPLNNGALGFYSLPNWQLRFLGEGHTIASVSLSQVIWAYDGYRVAYPSKSGRTIKIRNLRARNVPGLEGTLKTINVPQALGGPARVANIRWSKDDRWIAFTVRGPSRVRLNAFLVNTTGKPRVRPIASLRP